MAATHSVLMSPAGLTSAESHVAHDRWVPIKDSNDYSDHFEQRRSKQQSVFLPIPTLTTAYSNLDIDYSSPTNRAILACNGLPRNFKAGSRCVNPLEPRYVLPGCSPSHTSPEGGAATASEALRNPSPGRRSGSERLLLPAMSLPRGSEGPGVLGSPKLQPLPHSPSGNRQATGSSGSHPLPSAPPPPLQPQPSQPTLGPNANVYVNGSVGGLLLYGPTPFTAHGATAAGAAATSVAAPAAMASPVPDRMMDVTDINGQRRSISAPRRNGGFDPLYISDIVPPRKQSPIRALKCLSTSDIRGAAPRARTRDIPSPGRGTLNSADIIGAAPGCLTRPSPSTYALGRWPAPAVPQYQFPHSTRVTLMKKPIAIGE